MKENVTHETTTTPATSVTTVTTITTVTTATPITPARPSTFLQKDLAGIEMNPGVIIDVIPLSDTTSIIPSKTLGFNATCLENGEGKIRLKVEFEIEVEGIIKTSNFKPEETHNPMGDEVVYIKFDNVDKKSFTNKVFNKMIQVSRSEGSNAVLFTMGVPDIGKTRWGI
ncbi:hypothetical protein SAMN05428949_5870 [Chitinophaga sp. YR627]|uniref:hypothetical protein n=1 Tax=Chitinophaga sp. YR627 TaxID=1881041 RepID=UPI0008EDB3C2|nr:hypothetical protein [Chitinophaga sp. YR627]SFO58355.1 hypothetical protein SAMN05428949_5870 [Chitinophaga sp. YR627]